MQTRSTIIAFSLSFFVSVHGAEYEGAAKLLERVESSLSSGKVVAHDPVTALKGRIVEFRKSAGTMTPDAAATGWLELYDAYAAVPASVLGERWSQSIKMEDLIKALPPSSAWEAMDGQISKRADTGGRVPLVLMMRSLRGTPDDVPGTVAMVRAAYEDVRNASVVAPSKGFDDVLENGPSWGDDVGKSPEALLSTALNLRAGRPEDVKTTFLGKLERLEKDPEGNSRYLELPKMEGVDADALIVRAIKAGAIIEWPDEEVRRRAIELILKDPGMLKAPIWNLAEGMLYDQMVERFPVKTGNSIFGSATRARMASLLEEGNTGAARKLFVKSFARNVEDADFLKSFPSSEEKAGTKSLMFLEELLTAAPILPFWSNYQDISSKLGRNAEALAFMKKTAASPETLAGVKSFLEVIIINTMTEVGEVDAAMEVMRSRVGSAAAKAPRVISDQEVAMGVKQLQAVGIEATGAAVKRMLGSTAREEEEIMKSLPLKLAEIGRLLKKPEWVEEGISAEFALVAKEKSRWNTTYELVRALMKNDRGPEAERLLSEWMIVAVSTEDMKYYRLVILKELVQVYREAGRWEDIVTLLDKSPHWEATDLANVKEYSVETSVIFAAAQAFAATGKKDIAAELVDRLLLLYPKRDAVYQLLLDLGGPEVEAKLDRLAKANRFEERPLIWKAVVQLREGRTEEAEKTIRAAIAIDPSDGEEGKGDRMRAYAVLADVLEKKGDMEQAKIMRGAVAAVRLSEDADDFRGAGLTKKAAEMYEEALTLFADAYCIQSRLALTYSQAGEDEKAEEHFRRAFELMPDSFGRIESHCFGCEGTFSKPSSQGVAEKVFTRLMVERPDSAQVFYLMGYLRDSQDRDEEAASAFRRALEIDPDCVNAWVKLGGVTVKRPEGEDDAIAINLLRLGVGGTGSLGVVSNLPSLWDAILAKEAAALVPSTGPVYRLAASTAGEGRSRAIISDVRDSFTMNQIVGSTVVLMDLLIPRE